MDRGNLNREMDRRRFLGGGAAGVGALALGADPAKAFSRGSTVFRRRGRRGPSDARGVGFKQGVAAGEPRTDGITLWTRLEGIDRDSGLRVEVSSDRDFRRVLVRERVQAERDRDFTVHARLRSSRLKPGERYYYRFFTTDDESSPVGRFRTALPSDSREPVRIGFFSCQQYESGFYTAHSERGGLAAQDDLDIVVCLGDYIYERASSDDDTRIDRTGENRDGEAQKLFEYRQKYGLYHGDADLREVRRMHPLQAIWDDHEFENDYAGDQPSEGNSNVKERRVRYLKRRRNAYRAFFEHMPMTPDRDDRFQIFGRVRLGANADLFLLDERRFRDRQPCGGRTGTPCPRAEREDPDRTLLGRRQKRWFKRALSRSQATWKVVGNQVMIMGLEFPARSPVNPDQWDGYAAERRELLEFVQREGIENVTFITGDIHTFFAGNVTPSGRQGVPSVDGVAAATEFVGGSITSKGIADSLGGDDGRETAALLTDQAVYANNPHIRYSDQAFKGYGVLEARRDELRVEYRKAATTQKPRSRVSTLQRFRVETGVPRVEVVDPPLTGPQPLPMP